MDFVSAYDVGINRPDIPEEVLVSWQEIVDSLANIADVPAALIMHVLPEKIEVARTSRPRHEENPYTVDASEDLGYGLYCETVMKYKSELHVKNSLKAERWRDNPDVRLGMISYYGQPLLWPDKSVYGTICILDETDLVPTDTVKQLLGLFRRTIEKDLGILEQTNMQKKLIQDELDTQTHEIYRQNSELKELVQNLERAEQIADFGSWEWDMQSDEVLWSDQVFRIFGESPQDFVVTKDTFFSYVPQKEHAKIHQAIEQALIHQGRYDVEHSVVLKDKMIRYLKGWGELSFTPEGEPKKLHGVFLDITEKHFLRDELSQQKEIYERLYHDSSDGVGLLEDGLFIDWNESWIKMLGYDTNMEMIGLSPVHLSPEYQPDGVSSSQRSEMMIKQAFREGPQRFEWVHQKADGTTLWCDVLLTPINIHEKDVIFSVIRDISDSKAMEEELESLTHGLRQRVQEEVKKNEQQAVQIFEQSRLAQMGEMISMIAHQWRQPLASISAITGTLSLDLMMNKYRKEFFEERLDAITKLSQHLSSTIDDFRDFFKVEKEQKMVTLDELIKESLSIIGPTLRSRNIKIIEEIDTEVMVLTYQNELKQVILNLLQNAEDALIERDIDDAVITIRGSSQGKKAIIEVEDNAGGIAEDICGKIFDPYFSTKRQKDGTGLGLYMSKTIIEDHCGGSLTLKNVQYSTCFSLKLPLRQKETTL